MKTTYYILFLSFFVTISSCSSDSIEMTEEELAISEKLKSKFEGVETLIYNQDTLLASKEVLDYYNTNAFSPIWIADDGFTEQGDSLYRLIGDARDYGLLPEMYHYKYLSNIKDSSDLDAEMIMSNAFFLFTTHVDVGCVDSSTFQYVWKKDSLDYSLAEELDKVREGENVIDIIESHEPDFWDYQQLRTGLTSFLDEYPLDTNNYKIPAFKEDSTQCYEIANDALFGHAFLDSTNRDNDSIFIENIKSFQKLNGLKDDAIVGKWTGRALEKSNTDRFYNAAVTMERWRWKREKFPSRHIRVNIPEFTLYFINNDSVKRKHRVVVGAYATQTPEFRATMRRMVTNPFWHVPYSISSTEILYGAKKDSNYFSKRGYKIFKNGDQVDPSTVNWSSIGQNSFPYKVRQNGGGGNSLGRIKFLFPNLNFVFIHDTPSKRLFSNDVRAYSHGCVRLHNPFDLAKEMLLADQHQIQADTLDSLVQRGTQRTIELDEPFEVFIEYFTTTGDSTGQIIFHPDIYGRDEQYYEHTFKKFSN